VLGHASPYYPLYALLFLATGLTEGQVSGLFALWSVVGFLAEVPAGVLADRWSRRGSLVLAGLLEAAGFTLWTALPGLPAFAAGFALWGLGGALQSGAAEALVYDGLAAAGVPGAYARVNGWIAATQVLAAVPSAGLAAGLHAAGGFALVGWVSVGGCLATAAAATRLPEPPRTGEDDDADHDAAGWWRRATRALRGRALLLLVAAVALVGGLDAVEEFFPLMAGAWGVPTSLVPLAVLVVPLAGALGAALGGRAGRSPGGVLAGALACAGVLLAVAAVWARPLALGAVAVGYGLHLAVLVVAEARLQERIRGRYRATLTSVAALGVELTALLVYAAWALRGTLGVAVLVLGAVPVLAAALHTSSGSPQGGGAPTAPGCSGSSAP
jgi:MFS family permease